VEPPNARRSLVRTSEKTRDLAVAGLPHSLPSGSVVEQARGCHRECRIPRRQSGILHGRLADSRPIRTRLSRPFGGRARASEGQAGEAVTTSCDPQPELVILRSPHFGPKWADLIPRYARTVALSTPIRLVCLGGSAGRRVCGGRSRREERWRRSSRAARDSTCTRRRSRPVSGCPTQLVAASQLAEFPTTVRGLVALRDWLEAHRVTHVAMEATGVSPSARARPTGCTRRSRTPASSSTVSPPTSSAAAGRCSDAICQGTTDPDVLADLARGRLRAKLPQLREALEGRFDAQHALVVGAILAHLDFLDEQIQLLSDAIEEALALSPRRLSCPARSPASSGARPR